MRPMRLPMVPLRLPMVPLQLLLLLPVAAAQHTLRNDAITASFSDSRLVGVGSVQVAGDDFELELQPVAAALGAVQSTVLLASAAAAAKPTVQPGANATSIAFRWAFDGFSVEAQYRLVSDSAGFVEKQLRLLPPAGSDLAATFNLTRVAVFNSTAVKRTGATPASSLTASSHYGLGAYAVFHRFDAAHGAYLSCQNPYLTAVAGTGTGSTTLSYAPLMLGQGDGSFEFDAGIIGLTNLTGETLPKPADPLDVGEQGAMVNCLREYLVVPPSANSTVKINIAWTENDFQLDIADPGNRTCVSATLAPSSSSSSSSSSSRSAASLLCCDLINLTRHCRSVARLHAASTSALSIAPPTLASRTSSLRRATPMSPAEATVRAPPVLSMLPLLLLPAARVLSLEGSALRPVHHA